MTYPVISSPYGFKPYNLIGGRVFAGSTRMIPILNGYASNLNNGDIVRINTADGNLIALSQGTGAISTPGASQATVAGTIGVFLGCEYATSGGPIYGLNRFNNWVGGTTAVTSVSASSTTGVTGYVLDDPFAVFKVVAVANNGTANSTTVAAFGPAFLGSNVQVVSNYSATVPLTGDSLAGVCGTAGNAPITAASPFRVVQFVPETALSAATTITATATSITQTVASTTGIYVGMNISGTGVAAGTVVASITNSTTFVASVSITGTSGNAISFFGYPEVLVTWTDTYHSYTNSTGV